MGDQAALRGPVVVGGDDQDGVRSGLLRLPGQDDGLGRVVGPGAADDLAPTPGHLDHGAEEVFLLLMGQGGCLAGRTGHHQAVAAVLQQPCR